MKLTKEQVLYCRENYLPGHEEFGLKGLASKFNVSRDLMKDLVHGKTYCEYGGTIHPSRPRISTKIKDAIAAAYVPHSQDNNIEALAERFNLSTTTIVKILREKGKSSGRGKVTDELRAKIIAEYEPYVKDSTRTALAAKYNLSVATIANILREVETAKKPRPAVDVPDFLKEEIIVAHDEEQLSVKALAERFSLSRPQVRSVLLEAGIAIRTRKTVDEATKQEIIDAFKGGQSLRELESIYGINRATMSKWVEDFKPPKAPKKELDQATREQIYRYHSHGYGVTIIAKTIGISQQIVRKVIDGEL